MQKTDNKITEYLHGLNCDNTVLFRDNILWFVCFDIVFDSDTMQNLQYGAFKYALYQRDHIPFVLIEYGDLLFDFEINAYDLITSLPRRQFRSYIGNACFTLVSPHTHQVLAERHFYFNAHYVAHLKSCMQRQRNYYHSEFAVSKRIEELSEFLANHEMFQASKLYIAPAVKRDKN